ncbi:MAG: cobalamin B12-binding domain-containing protein [Rhodobacterales bacterium]|nr:cobalamin B12-binding domain-containing protein [Rhodobacterales bacterium]
MLGNYQQQVFESEANSLKITDQRRGRPNLSEEKVTSLAREVLSVVANRSARLDDPVNGAPIAEIDVLCRALICSDDSVGHQIIAKAREAGASPEAIYLGLLARAADQLGEWWNDGEATFTEVSIGTSRIHSIMRSMKPLFEKTCWQSEKAAFFASVPDETHTLGVKMAADLFRRAGWEITLQIGLTKEELISVIAKGGHRLVGLSAGGEHSLAQLQELVAAIRAKAPRTRILICGKLVCLDEDKSKTKVLSADAFAAGIEASVAELDRLWDEIQSEQLAT